MQRERLKTPYPWTWEIPAAVTVVVLLCVVLGIQVGRTLANLVAGAGMTWPAANTYADTSAGIGGVEVSSPIGAQFWTSLPGVLSGDAAAGLPTPAPDALAPPWLVWAAVSGIEVLFLSLTTWVGVMCATRWGPGRMRGMASAAEAEQLLGLTKLGKVSALVRPDVYGKKAALLSAPIEQDPLRSTFNPNGERRSPWLMVSRDRGETR
ncbi:hypothetical protein [Nocardioides sp.]|uniref:hypothetical protein n=1 Tax=Nocardioides sp. TaxID=35761 RepID=UPI00263032B8|nr:hypothetical protein [Nocardioides sp.]MCW2737790.1 hypothetical protein [Nocardioides sp.]